MENQRSIDEVLRRLSFEEMNTLKPLSGEIIDEAMRKGREEADKFSKYLFSSFSVPPYFFC